MLREYQEKGTVLAEQFDGSKKMRDKYWILHETEYDTDLDINIGELYYLTSIRGNIKINVGDWIIQTASNSTFPYEVLSNHEFKGLYKGLGNAS